jgi:hypothetical protein
MIACSAAGLHGGPEDVEGIEDTEGVERIESVEIENA